MQKLIGVLVLAAAFGAQAHHSVDPTTGMAIVWTGKITELSWDGAHVMYRIEVEDAQQRTSSWQVLGASPRVLRARRIQSTTFAKGDVVTVVGWLDPFSKMISPTQFITSDGREFDMGFYPASMRTQPNR